MRDPRVLLDALDEAHAAWRDGTTGWSGQAIEAVEAVPALTAAVRAALAFADELDVTFAGSSIQRTLRERVTAALVEVVEPATEVAG